MVKGGPEWNRLISGIQDAGIHAGLSFAEKLGDNLFMALTLIYSNRDELISHHKLRPSGAERDIFSDGTIDQLNVVTSAYGRAGFLECGEHQYPSMTFYMQAQAENFHLGPFSYMGDVGDDQYFWWEGALANTGTMGHSANLGGSYSFTAAVGYSFAVDLWLRLPHPLVPTLASRSVLYSTTIWKRRSSTSQKLTIPILKFPGLCCSRWSMLSQSTFLRWKARWSQRGTCLYNLCSSQSRSE